MTELTLAKAPARWAAVALMTLTVVGCSGAPDDGPDLVPVTGKVLLDGEPLEGAPVTFSPESGNRGAAGSTNAQGIFELGYAGKPGSPLGKQKVSISTRREIQDEFGGAIGMEPETIPTQYNGPQTTLTADVTADGQNEFVFDLTTDGTVEN